LLLGTLSCDEITAADAAAVTVVLRSVSSNAACVLAEPEPAAVRVKQGIAFANHSTVHVTLVLVDDDVPMVSVAPGDTSRAVKFSEAGIREYYSQACAGQRHTLAVTIN
jgi:hypothetical protein